MLLYILPCRQNKHPYMSDSFLMSERIQSVFQIALVSVQSSKAEVFLETSMKAWKRCFLLDLRTSQLLLIFSNIFVSMTIKPEVNFYCYF